MDGFLQSEVGRPDPDKCLFHILPCPLEHSVSYGQGTARAPEAILRASQQLEIYDGRSFPAIEGIFTHEPVPQGSSPEEALQHLEKAVTEISRPGRQLIILGGEHSLSSAPVRALKGAYGEFGVVQFDAHGDLRDEYDGNKRSHACVMRRIVEQGVPVCHIGGRALSPDDLEMRRTHKILTLDARNLVLKGTPLDPLPRDFPDRIYITVDVDVLDPSILPATGTPEPGGIGWYELHSLFRRVVQGREVLGFDVVEFAPIAGMHAWDYTVARLVYNLMGIVQRHAA